MFEDKTTGMLHYTIQHDGCPWNLPFHGIFVGFLWGLVIGRVDDMGDLVDAHFASNLVFRKVLVVFHFVLMSGAVLKKVISGLSALKPEQEIESGDFLSFMSQTKKRRMRPKKYGIPRCSSQSLSQGNPNYPPETTPTNNKGLTSY